MLRVGLTGGLASGKTAVGLVFAEGGAHVLSADAMGRALMQPGETVFARIVEHFGPGVLSVDGLLDRKALARLAFEDGRLGELNAIVHPAVFAAQAEALDRLTAEDPGGLAVVESALVFEVVRDGGEAARHWRERFDRVVLVRAPESLKVARYLARVAPADADAATRAALERDARARLAAQIPDEEKAPFCDFVIENNATLVLLRRRAQAVLRALQVMARSSGQ